MKRTLVTACVLVVALGTSPMIIARQGTPGSGGAASASAAAALQNGPAWPTYGGNLASHRYSPLDQITKENFRNLTVAWRLNTDRLGPRPDLLFQATPLYVNGVLYTTAGTRRAVVALNPGTGEMLWMHSEDEGPRGQSAPRQGSGRGLSYWSSTDGADQRILYVTPGYRLIALNAKNGELVRSFGMDGVVDLKQNNDQELDPVTGIIGLNATPLVVGDVIVVGAAHQSAGSPATRPNARGYIRGFDIKTGKRLWIFHTLPLKGEFGYDTWDNGSAERAGQLGAWAELSADLELGLVYVPTEMPSSDYYGVNRPGNGLFSESIVALDIKTGVRKWHYQTIHHGIWDWDLPCAPILYDMRVNGRVVKALAQPTKSAFLFVLNRETGEPIWPIEERPVPQSEVPGEKTSPTQPFPTKPLPFDRQGVSMDDLSDLTPALRAEAEEVVKYYRLGPLFTPPGLATPGGPLGTLMLPQSNGGANWPGGAFDPETNRLYIHSHTGIYSLSNVAPEYAVPGPDNEASTIRLPGSVPSTARGAAAPAGPARGAGGGGRGAGGGGGGGDDDGQPAGGRVGGRAGTVLQGSIPLIKPPYDRITAYDMNSGDMLWQKVHSSSPDTIRDHPALKGIDASRLGALGRVWIGVLPTKTMLIAGEGGVHTNKAGESVALLRAYDKATGEDVAGEVEMPGRQVGSPMTYMHNGKQYIVLAISTSTGSELLAFALR